MQDLYIPGISYQVLATINLGLWLVFDFFFFGGVGGGGGNVKPVNVLMMKNQNN